MNPSKSLKIGYVLKRFPRLSETFILNEMLQLERQGASIQIYSLIDPAVVEANGVRHGLLRELAAQVTYLPRKVALKGLVIKRGRFGDGEFAEEACKIKSAAFLQAATIGNIALAHEIGHLHAHFATDAATVALLASRLTGIPCSFTAHAKDIYHENVDRALLRRKIQDARFVITVSEFNRRFLAELAGPELASKIVRLYNGIDLARFKPDPRITREPASILAVGRLEEKKGFRHLIEACRLLHGSGQSFRCLIVGEGRERAALEQQIAGAGLADRVLLAGAQPQEQLIEAMKRATVLVLPCVISASGDRDALPTVLLEALASGLPAISTELVGIPEIIEHGKTGLLVPPGEPKSLAKAIEEVLKSPELQQTLAHAGRAKAEAVFDIRKNISVLQELFAKSAFGQKTIGEPAEELD